MRVSGKAQVDDLVRPWSAVLKMMDASGQSSIAQGGLPSREIAAYSSGLFSGADTGLRSAKVHSISESKDRTYWLWTEDLSAYGTEIPWAAFQYFSTAEVLARFNGRNLHGASSVCDWMQIGNAVSRWTNPKIAETCGALGSYRKSDYVRTALPGKSFDRALEFEKDYHVLAGVAQKLPTTLVHGDFHARNIFGRLNRIGGYEAVVIDLASVGIDLLGSDLGTLFGSALTWGDDEADTVMNIEREAFNTYLSVLRSEGCDIPDHLVRLGYLIPMCGYGMAAASIPAVVFGSYGPWEWSFRRYGASRQQLPFSYRRRIEFSISLFDEALEIVKHHGLA